MNDVALFATCGFNAHAGYGKLEIGLQRGLEAAGVSVAVNAADAPVSIITGNPTWALELDTGPRRWAYTMSEATQVSQQWVDCLNACYERVLVPCPPLAEVYRNSGVDIPVHYVPMGVDLHVPDWKTRTLNDERNVIMGYSLGDMRKNAQDTMLSWHRVFQDDPRFPLVIKCRDNPMWATNLVHPNTTIVRGEQSAEDYHALMDSAAVFVFPSRGEGFGLPPRETVLMGIPTIATQWLGLWDVDQWGYPVSVLEMWPAQFTEWDSNANAEGSYWANPSRTHLDAQLQWVIEHYDEAVAKTWQGRNYLLEHFTWERAGRMIAALLDC